MEKTLCESKEKQFLTIERITETIKSRARRLAEYGFVSGQKVFLIKKIGGVCLVEIRGYVLSIDNELAKKVIVCD